LFWEVFTCKAARMGAPSRLTDEPTRLLCLAPTSQLPILLGPRLHTWRSPQINVSLPVLSVNFIYRVPGALDEHAGPLLTSGSLCAVIARAEERKALGSIQILGSASLTFVTVQRPPALRGPPPGP
jgi:hypothetical protein